MINNSLLFNQANKQLLENFYKVYMHMFEYKSNIENNGMFLMKRIFPLKSKIEYL